MLLPPSETDGKTLIVFHFFLIEILLRYAFYLNFSTYQYYITQFAYVALLNVFAGCRVSLHISSPLIDVMDFDGTQESQ